MYDPNALVNLMQGKTNTKANNKNAPKNKQTFYQPNALVDLMQKTPPPAATTTPSVKQKQGLVSQLWDKVKSGIASDVAEVKSVPAMIQKEKERLKSEEVKGIKKEMLIPRIAAKLKAALKPWQELAGKGGYYLGRAIGAPFGEEVSKETGKLGREIVKEGVTYPFVGLEGTATMAEAALRNRPTSIIRPWPGPVGMTSELEKGLDKTLKKGILNKKEKDYVLELAADNLKRKIKESGGADITQQQAKNYLITGNFEGDLNKIDNKEVAKAWYASMLDYLLDSFFVATMGVDVVNSKLGKLPDYKKIKIRDFIGDDGRKVEAVVGEPTLKTRLGLPLKSAFKTETEIGNLPDLKRRLAQLKTIRARIYANPTATTKEALPDIEKEIKWIEEKLNSDAVKKQLQLRKANINIGQEGKQIMQEKTKEAGRQTQPSYIKTKKVDSIYGKQAQSDFEKKAKKIKKIKQRLQTETKKTEKPTQLEDVNLGINEEIKQEAQKKAEETNKQMRAASKRLFNKPKMVDSVYGEPIYLEKVKTVKSAPSVKQKLTKIKKAELQRQPYKPTPEDIAKAEELAKKWLPKTGKLSSRLKAALKKVPEINKIKVKIKAEPEKLNKKILNNIISTIFKEIRKKPEFNELLRGDGFTISTARKGRRVAEYDFSSRKINFDTRLKHYLLSNYYGRESGGYRPTRLTRGVPTFGLDPRPKAGESFSDYVARQIKELTQHELAHGITTINDVELMKQLRAEGRSATKIQQQLHQMQRERLNKLFGKDYLKEPELPPTAVEKRRTGKPKGRPKDELSMRAIKEKKKAEELKRLQELQKQRQELTKKEIKLRSARKLPSPAIIRLKAASQPNKKEVLETLRKTEDLFRKRDTEQIVKEYHNLLKKEIEEGTMAENPEMIYPSDVIRSYWEKHYPNVTLEDGVSIEFNPDMLAEEGIKSKDAFLTDIYKEINRWAARNEEAEVLADLSKKELQKDAVRKGLAEVKGKFRKKVVFKNTDLIVVKKDGKFIVQHTEAGKGIPVSELLDRYLAKPEKYERYLTPEMKQHAKLLRKTLDDLWAIAKHHKIIEEYRENYVPGIYRDDPKTLSKLLGGGKNLEGKPFFSRQKKFESPEDAELFGLHPIYDPYAKMEVYIRSLRRTIANKNLVQTMKGMVTEEGVPLFLPMQEGKKYGYVPLFDTPGFTIHKFIGLDKKVTAEGVEKRTTLLFKQPLSTTPEVNKLLQNIFKPYPSNEYYRAYKKLTYIVLRLLLYNPLFHGMNIYSMGFITSGLYSPYKVVGLGIPKPIGISRVMLSGATKGGLAENTYLGRALKENFGWDKGPDEALLYMAKSGVKVSEAKKAGELLNRRFGEIYIDIPPDSIWNKIPLIKHLPHVVNTAAGFNDYLLWEVMVRNLQTYLFFGLRHQLATSGKRYTQEQIDKMAANYTNVVVGTLPTHWFSRIENILLDGTFLAKNWTISNIQLATGALGKLHTLKWGDFKPPKIGKANGKNIEITTGDKPILSTLKGKNVLPNALRFKGYNEAELKELAKWYRKFLIGGMIYKIIFDNAMQYGTAKIQGEKFHPTWQNEKGHKWDIDTYTYDKKGRRRYIHSPFGKALVDLMHWGAHPTKTLHSKMEPVLRTQYELFVSNHDRFRGEDILKPGMTRPEKVWEVLKYEFEQLTPYGSLVPPGYVADPFEISVRFSGTWVRHGLAANLRDRYQNVRKADRRELFDTLGVEKVKRLLYLMKKMEGKEPLTKDEKLEASKLAMDIIEFQQRKGYLREKDDEDIDRSIISGDYYNALNKIINTGRYTTIDAILKRFLRVKGEL